MILSREPIPGLRPEPIMVASSCTIRAPSMLTQRRNPLESHEMGTIYEIRIKGHLSERWAMGFDPMTIRYDGGETVLVGRVPDQAALFGILNRIRDLSLHLVSLKEVPSPNIE